MNVVGKLKSRRPSFLFSLIYLCLICAQSSYAYNWQKGESLPTEGLANPYEVSDGDLHGYVRSGLLHALNYPVDVTATIIPGRLVDYNYEFLQKLMGLSIYPEVEGEGSYFVPFKNSQRPEYAMGLTPMTRFGAKGVTFSCAACHSTNLFGRQIVGLTNRFPGANRVIDLGVTSTRAMPTKVFKSLFKASKEEEKLYDVARRNLFFVEAKKPQVLGLDTSLAHVALSLSHRALDGWASLNIENAKNPRAEFLRDFVADSKPAVWWNVKYKNRWLSDGSVVSGNPILTNILWNEIGRGTDLRVLNDWINNNAQIIKELTTAVYQASPPAITDFISADRFKLSQLKKGAELFENKCAKCHGHYLKGWQVSGSEAWPMVDQLRTVQVQYFANTKVMDVGTDEQRYIGMRSLAQLNDLEISRNHGILIEPQRGYVPPPLVGIWARYPYLHNNSIPNLCELLKPSSERVLSYWSGEQNNPDTDFDLDCNGYPLGGRVPSKWRTPKHYYNTRLPGLSNKGHDFRFSELGNDERRALIQYLQTL